MLSWTGADGMECSVARRTIVEMIARLSWNIRSPKPLARISHGFKRIGAPNQRKLFCENDFLMIRGEPRCKQSVSRICLDLKPSKAAR